MDNPLPFCRFLIDPYAAFPSLYSLCSLAFSDFERNPAASVFAFGIFVKYFSRIYSGSVKYCVIYVGKINVLSFNAKTKSANAISVSLPSNKIVSLRDSLTCGEVKI